MCELIYSIIVIVHTYRFPLVVCLLIISTILAIILTKRNVRLLFLMFSLFILALLVFMVLIVEFRSPFSKPSINEQQTEVLFQALENDSEQVIKAIKESGTKREVGLKEGYSLNSQCGVYIAVLYDKTEYFEAYDLLKKDMDFEHYEYSDKYDFREELKSNGYFEQDNSKGVRVICYPVFYRVSSKASIYLPFEPDGGYQESVVMVFDNTVIEFIGASELKCTLDLSKKIQVIIDQLK